jgi:ketosteroid isomerase-like protein
MKMNRISLGLVGSFMLLISACQSTSVISQTDKRIEMADAFFEAMFKEDRQAVTALMTEASIVHAPYNPNGDASDAGIRTFPARLYVLGAMQTYDNLKWENKKYSLSDSGQTLWVEANGKLSVAQTGKPYHNRYVFKIDFENDKIATITEYTNVATLAKHGVVAGAN